MNYQEAVKQTARLKKEQAENGERLCQNLLTDEEKMIFTVRQKRVYVIYKDTVDMPRTYLVFTNSYAGNLHLLIGDQRGDPSMLTRTSSLVSTNSVGGQLCVHANPYYFWTPGAYSHYPDGSPRYLLASEHNHAQLTAIKLDELSFLKRANRLRHASHWEFWNSLVTALQKEKTNAGTHL